MKILIVSENPRVLAIVTVDGDSQIIQYEKKHVDGQMEVIATIVNGSHQDDEAIKAFGRERIPK